MKKYIRIIQNSFFLSFFLSVSSTSAQNRTPFTANIGYAVPVVGVPTEHLAKATTRLVYIPDNLFNNSAKRIIL